MLYLSGVTNDLTVEAERADLGILVTPQTRSMYDKRVHYPAWAADNGCFAEATRSPIPPCTWPPTLGGRGEPAVASWIRYRTPHHHRLLDFLAEANPDGCLFATLPDVVGDHAATWERSAMYVTRVAALGFRPAIVMQDGLEHDRFVWGSMLNAAEHHDGALFVGGSTEWKLSHATAMLVAEAKDRGLWVHMGRVNSYRRLRYAQSIGCDSADGTYLARAGRAGTPRVLKWLDRVNGEQLVLPTPEGEPMTRLAPAPPMVSGPIVKRGNSARVGRARAAKEKADANAQAVARMNARARAADACDISSDGSLPPLSGKERMALYEEAKRENTAAKAAQALGQPVPPTPHLDEMKRRQDMAAATKKSGTSTKRVESARRKKANEARAAAKGKSGDGRSVTDQELLDHIVSVRKAHPDTDLVTERRYARFVEKMSFGQPRWAAMWALAEKGVTTAPDSGNGASKATAKKAPAKKAPAKKAEASKAVAPKGTEKRTPPSKVPGATKKTPGQKAREARAATTEKAALKAPAAKAPSKQVTPLPKAKDVAKKSA